MKIRLLAVALLAFVMGIIAGSLVSSPARAIGLPVVHVDEVTFATSTAGVPLTGTSHLTPTGVIGPPRQVVGFSCTDTTGQPRCFVASVER
jgi:hypothetical protein